MRWPRNFWPKRKGCSSSCSKSSSSAAATARLRRRRPTPRPSTSPSSSSHRVSCESWTVQHHQLWKPQKGKDFWLILFQFLLLIFFMYPQFTLMPCISLQPKVTHYSYCWQILSLSLGLYWNTSPCFYALESSGSHPSFHVNFLFVLCFVFPRWYSIHRMQIQSLHHALLMITYPVFRTGFYFLEALNWVFPIWKWSDQKWIRKPIFLNGLNWIWKTHEICLSSTHLNSASRAFFRVVKNHL